MTIKGKAGVKRLLSRAGPETLEKVADALGKAARLIENEAKNSITTGSVGGARHVPSRPGEPPNQDTGFLANNIETTRDGPFRVLVSSNAPYSQPLEFGTSKMAARPFMRPAADKHRAEIQKFVAEATRKALKEAQKG